MDTPQTLSYQLPNALPDRLRKAKVAHTQRTAIILTAVGATVLAMLLALILLATTTSENTNPTPTAPPSQTTTPTAPPPTE